MISNKKGIEEYTLEGLREAKKQGSEAYLTYRLNYEDQRKKLRVEGRKNYRRDITNRYMRKYTKRPEVKEKIRDFAREYQKRPYVMEKTREYMREYGKRPEPKRKRRDYAREYVKRPEVRERLRETQRRYRAKLKQKKIV